jgi:hypothetical protein
MTSFFGIPRRVRIHGEGSDAVARALHHEAEINSLPAAFEKVSNATYERKLMLRTIAFKRISLAVISALAFGTLSSVAPAQAGGLDDTLTLSASSATVTVNETATVTATVTFTSQLTTATKLGPDSVIVHVAGKAPGTLITALPVADTVNTNTALYGKTIVHLPQVLTAAAGNTGVSVGNETRLVTTGGSDIGTAGTGFRTDSIVAVAAGAYTKASFKISAPSVSTPGTYIWTISVRDNNGSSGTVLYKTATFTLTVTAGDNTGTTASKLWLHNTLYENMAINTNVGTPTADSTLVVNAGSAATPTIVGYMVPEFYNAAGDTKNATSGTQHNESLTVVVSGPGLLGSYVGRADHTADSVLGKSVIVQRGDTVIVYSDGTAGVGTFTGSIGGVNLTQAAKTITFVGKPASFTITSDSAQVVSSAAIAYQSISFVVKDSAGSAINGTNVQYNTGTPGAFYLTVTDTKVVGGTAVVNTGTNAFTACAYNSTRLRWFCDVPITDSGSVTVTISDSKLASNAVVTATATYTVVGAAAIGTMALDKASYKVGEIATLTLTAKDRNGNNAANGAQNPFGTMSWSKAPTFTITTGSNAAGGTFGKGASTYTTLEGYVAGGTTYVNGVDTAVVYMPDVAGTYTLTTTTNGTVATPVTLTFTVVDAAADATIAAANASTAAAEAATDAAAEAIDAANAATDAANLAAEAADAATVAAEEARDAADAATAAVEELATQVATLMAALKAQITTLANTVAKIAKKVKA